MKKDIKINKNIMRILIIVLIIVASIFLIMKIFKNKNTINNVNNGTYSFDYDNTWELSKKEDLEAKLVHKKSKSELDIKISQLDEETQYKAMEELADSLLYNIQKQNESYKLVYKEQVKLTNQDMDGYKMLFEANENQVAIYTYKQSEKLVVFVYEATYEYFDILLDNVNSIIYSFNLIEKSFDVQTYIDIETKPIEYTEDDKVTELVKDSKEYEITHSNYNIKFTVPSCFKTSSIDSRSKYFSIKGLENSKGINLNVYVLNQNLYEFLDKKISGNIYERYKDYVLDSEAIDKYEGSPLHYIYRNKYLLAGTEKETVKVVYELDRNHILLMELETRNAGITKQLMENIKVNEIQNVASSIKREVEDGFLIGTLKHYTDFNNEQIETITLKLPEDFEEKDASTNLYSERRYINNYDANLQYPEYEVTYSTESNDIESILERLDKNKESGIVEYNGFTEVQEKTYNEKVFKVSTRNYSRLTQTNPTSGKKIQYNTNEIVLVYKARENRYLSISIKANNTEITDELINKLTNFDINVE